MRILLRRAAWLVLAVLLAYMGVRMLAAVGSVPPSPIKPTPIGGGTGRIAFAVFSKNQIYTAKADGTGLIHVADLLEEPLQLQWASDGTHLAVLGINGDIYVMRADGSNLIHLAKTEGVGFFSWSPDSKKLAYDSYAGSNFLSDLQIYTVNVDGTELTQLTRGSGNHGHPAWAPDGRQIAFQFTTDPVKGGYEIHLINVDGSREISIARGFTYSQDILWSPDGSHLLIASGNPVQIYVISVDGLQRKQLTTTPDSKIQPSWSPDGRLILYTAFGRDGGSKVYVMNADGTNQKQLTNDPGVGDGFAEWSPDSQWITYTSTRIEPEANCCTNCCVTVYIMKADGSERRRLTNEIESTWQATWQP